MIVNPNSPTGTIVSTEEIRVWAHRHRETVFVVDESFLPFSDEPSIVAALEHEPLPNVIVLTSLSKSLGVPGLRLGYMYSCDPGTIAAIGKELPVWNVNAPAEFFLDLLLKFRVELQQSLDRSVVDRENLRRDLCEPDVVDHVHASHGNFLLTCLVGDSADMARRTRRLLLADFRIEVKDVSSKFPDGRPRLRIAVRTPDDNALLVKALSALGAGR